MTRRHPDGQHDEYETMPWAMLADELDRGKNRTMALTVLAAIAVGILAFMVVRSIRQAPGTVVEIPAAAEQAETVATTHAPVMAATATTLLPAPSVTPVAPVDPVLYTEEDLRAGVPDVDMRLAVVRAEWFVSEYFSTGQVSDGLIPEGATERSLPDGAYSWVEWARAIAVDAVGGGRYDVTVVFRTMAGDGEHPIAATAPRTVLVPVLVDDDGASAVIDLPAPVPLPDEAGVDPLPEPAADVPQPVAAAALEEAAAFGDATVVGGTRLAVGWRVVVTVTDVSGAAFPLAVLVTG
ncbi:MAG: hypothetical protein ACR2JP_11920 [Acidimicrobiia bacterium]